MAVAMTVVDRRGRAGRAPAKRQGKRPAQAPLFVFVFLSNGFCCTKQGTSPQRLSVIATGRGPVRIWRRIIASSSYGASRRVDPAVHALSTTALQRIVGRKIIVCPNPKLGDDVGVIWYGNHRAIVWNPDAEKAVEAMTKILGDMAANDEFPDGIKSWNAVGEELKPAGVVPGIDYAVRADAF